MPELWSIAHILLYMLAGRRTGSGSAAGPAVVEVAAVPGTAVAGRQFQHGHGVSAAGLKAWPAHLPPQQGGLPLLLPPVPSGYGICTHPTGQYDPDVQNTIYITSSGMFDRRNQVDQQFPVLSKRGYSKWGKSEF